MSYCPPLLRWAKGEKMAWSIVKHIREHADYYLNLFTEYDFKKRRMRIRGTDDNDYLDFESFRDGYLSDDIKSNDMFEYVENEDRAEKFLTKTEHKKFIHFKLSFNLIDFEDEDEARETLRLILTKLLDYTIEVEEKNGVRVKKDGTRVQKYRKRKIEIGKWLLAGAVHTRGFDEKWLVNPHIHLLFDKKARLGKNFIYLKKAILDIKKELGIKQKTSFEEKSINMSRKFKSVMNARSWAIRQGKNLQKKTFELFENDVIKYLEKSKNLEFALKSFLLLEERGRAYGFYPYFLENKIKEFIYNFLDFRENETAILKLIKKERFYIKNEKDSPFKYFFTEKMYFDVRDFVFLVRNPEKDFYPQFTIMEKAKEEQSQSRGMGR